MDVRKLVRGSPEWDDIERIGQLVTDEYVDSSEGKFEFILSDNWLSTVCVVNERIFLKMVTRQNTAIHRVFTASRNAGSLSITGNLLFDRFESPIEMVEYEHRTLRRMQDAGVNAPSPIDTFEYNGVGVLLAEYINELQYLTEISEKEKYISSVFNQLRTLHDAGIGHGDIRGENLIISNDELYFIDPTNIRTHNDFKYYDLASALATIAPLIGEQETVQVALDYYSEQEVMQARRFVPIISIRPDHEFNQTKLQSTIIEEVG